MNELSRVKKHWPVVAVALGLSIAFGVARADGHDERREEHARVEHFDRAHEHFDSRFHHDRAYPVRGFAVGVLPREHFEVIHGGAHYFYAGGVWYAPRGPGFVVVGPPIGVFVPILPGFYTTLWVGAVPYYYANDTYYVYRGPSQGYEVVDPPAETAVSTQAPRTEDNLFIYPRNGQNPDQQSRDRYECHTWAASQTGFDPSATGGGVPPQVADTKRADYNRAMSACLEGRGYTVK